MLAEAGFAEATFHGWTGYRTSSCTQGGLITARKPTDPTASDVQRLLIGAKRQSRRASHLSDTSRSSTPAVAWASNREMGSLAAQAIPRSTHRRKSGSSNVHV